MAKTPIVDIGDGVDVPIEFTVAGVLTDPTEVTVKLQLGDDTEQTYSGAVASLPAEITRQSGKPTGAFLFSFVATVAGETTVRWFGDGALDAAWERTFTVRASRFATPLAKS